MLQYDFVPGKVPDSYKPVPWTDKLERIPNDYGAPVHTKYPEASGKEWWEEVEEVPQDITEIIF